MQNRSRRTVWKGRAKKMKYKKRTKGINKSNKEESKKRLKQEQEG